MYLYIVTRLWKEEEKIRDHAWTPQFCWSLQTVARIKNCIIHDYIWWLQKKTTAAQNLKAPVVAVNPLTLSSSCCLYSRCPAVLLFSRIRFWQSRLQVASLCTWQWKWASFCTNTQSQVSTLFNEGQFSVCVCVFPSRWFVCFCPFSSRLKGQNLEYSIAFSKVKTLWVLILFFFFSANPLYKNFKITKMS